jgi:ectoine hydroxylase-related dioxygenase (phytanoyl-CoA dioxygenase family)
MQIDLALAASEYEQQGFYSPVPVLSRSEADRHLAELSNAEARLGNLHYRQKIHTVFRSPLELATHKNVLDVVEALIGPDILLYNVQYIIKEAESASFVSLHQDLTYWGFSADSLTSMWLALTPAAEINGCMSMIRGSHRSGAREHRVVPDPNNILYQNQTADRIDADDVQLCPLAPGQASFHHGWTLHQSGRNRSGERRIGLNAQYISPAMSKEKGHRGTALLVRGVDTFCNFDRERLAEYDFEPAALLNREALEALHLQAAARPNADRD